ncbi:MAG: PilZ domain-containing protein [Candidatus Competibacteraceae bacterium]|nr:PilZ domain-containing protein [Candidatus Competibacteraceae bacterium]
MTTPDQRKLKRHRLIYYLTIFDASNEKEIGHLVDITLEGAGILSETPIPVGVQINLRIMLPATFPDIDYFEIQAKSVRNSCDVNTSYYNIGFFFVNTSPDNHRIIEYLISEYQL